MKGLNEVIKKLDCELERVRSNLDIEVCYYTISNCTELLRELAKPVKHIVEYTYVSKLGFTSDYHGRYFLERTLLDLRIEVVNELNDARELIGFNKINVDEIIFVEV